MRDLLIESENRQDARLREVVSETVASQISPLQVGLVRRIESEHEERLVSDGALKARIAALERSPPTSSF